MGTPTPARRRGADSLSDELAALRRRLDVLERRGPQLAYSSVEDGAITWNDADGTPTMVVGAQPDGTNAPTVVAGPVPPGAVGVTAEQGVNSIIVAWYGTFLDDAPAPLDYARAEFHISTDGPDFPCDVVGLGDPSTTLLATLESARGGRAVVSGLPYEEHWVKVVIRSLSGKFSVESEAISITPRQVATEDVQFGAIQAENLAVGAVTAEKLDVQVLQAGFTVTGKLQIGASYWTPTELVFPQPDGTFTRFSSDGTGQNILSGAMTADSLTVKKDLNILGTTNKISGAISLSNGITPPVTAPTISYTWDYVQGNAGALGNVFFGLCELITDANVVVRASSFFGGGIHMYSTSTMSDVTSLYNVTGVSTWGGSWEAGTQFLPVGGIATDGTNYFVLGQDQARAYSWWIYRLRPSDFAKTGEIYLGPSTGIPARPAISATSSNILVGYAQGNNIYFFDYNPATLSLYGTGSIPLAGIGSANLHHFSRGAYDWPGGGVRYVIGVDNQMSYVWEPFVGSREGDQYIWGAPFGELLLGQVWSPSRSRWLTISNTFRLSTLSTYKSATSVKAAYTWYDGIGTTRETTPSPTQTLAIPGRSYPFVQTGLPPDSGVTDPLQVDKANRVGVYAATGANALRLQSYLGVDGSGTSIRTLRLDTINTGGAGVPVSNTFVGGTSSPGLLQSAKADGAGPIILLQGSGAGRVGPLKWDANGVATTDGMGTWVNFACNWPNVPIGTVHLSKYMRIGNTVWVRQVCTLGGALLGGALIDMPFAAQSPILSSLAPVGDIVAIRSGVGWFRGWLYQTTSSPARLRPISINTATTATAGDWATAYPASWASGDQWGLHYMYEAVPL